MSSKTIDGGVIGYLPRIPEVDRFAVADAVCRRADPAERDDFLSALGLDSDVPETLDEAQTRDAVAEQLAAAAAEKAQRAQWAQQ